MCCTLLEAKHCKRVKITQHGFVENCFWFLEVRQCLILRCSTLTKVLCRPFSDDLPNAVFIFSWPLALFFVASFRSSSHCSGSALTFRCVPSSSLPCCTLPYPSSMALIPAISTTTAGPPMMSSAWTSMRRSCMLRPIANATPRSFCPRSVMAAFVGIWGSALGYDWATCLRFDWAA